MPPSDGALDERLIREARAILADGRRVLDTSPEGDLDNIALQLGEALDVIEKFVRAAELVLEIRSPTWRLAYRERDRVVFCNAWGRRVPLSSRLAVSQARGEALAATSSDEGDDVVFDEGDGVRERVPKSLLMALAPRRWPAASERSEVNE